LCYFDHDNYDPFWAAIAGATFAAYCWPLMVAAANSPMAYAIDYYTWLISKSFKPAIQQAITHAGMNRRNKRQHGQVGDKNVPAKRK
jgi:hypothetical protein